MFGEGGGNRRLGPLVDAEFEQQETTMGIDLAALRGLLAVGLGHHRPSEVAVAAGVGHAAGGA